MRTLLTLLALASSLAIAEVAHADGGVKVGWYSQQLHPSRAAVGAHIQASADRQRVSNERRTTPGSNAQQVVATITVNRPAPQLPPRFPVLPSSSPILRDQHPGGPGSFWYTDGAGHTCQYVPNSVTPCFTVVGPGAKPSSGGLSPSAVAASLTRRLELSPGSVETSPARVGLTGADSWFWLEPAPQRQTLLIALAGETVSVVADPTVEWRFGDGGSLEGGPGVPYEPGAASAGSIRHLYETRCLPGDQGHDPYVLASCGTNGYSVAAVVVWRISYSAAGPVGESGTLPTRTTENSTAYPVSESRAFLVSGGGR
jgi:hypothetical protein